jgi:hypothetical protein
MTGPNNVKIAGIALIIIVFLIAALSHTAENFRLLLQLVFQFVSAIAWPLAAVLIVLILRQPLSDLITRSTGKMHGPAPAPSEEISETAPRPDAGRETGGSL